jgi:hypothetical protein
MGILLFASNQIKLEITKIFDQQTEHAFRTVIFKTYKKLSMDKNLTLKNRSEKETIPNYPHLRS